MREEAPQEVHRGHQHEAGQGGLLHKVPLEPQQAGLLGVTESSTRCCDWEALPPPNSRQHGSHLSPGRLLAWNIACCLTAMRVALLRREAASTLTGPGLSMLLVRMTTPSLNRAATLQRGQATLSGGGWSNLSGHSQRP